MFPIEVGSENKILRAISKPVEVFDDALVDLVNEMGETMLQPDPKTGVKGVGLAANQVGKSIRVILITLNVQTRKKPKIAVMINPEIIELSEQTVEMEEGCLSLPGEFKKITRPARVKARWQNLSGNWCERKFDKWDARIFLHEFDHLEGVLFTDYLK